MTSPIWLEFDDWGDATPCPPRPVDPSLDECRHTPVPGGYTAFHAWCEEAAKTHDQARCPRCGLWAVWVPKGA